MINQNTGLTALVLVKDEAFNMDDLLKNLSFLPHVLVVDTGSRDETIKIASAHENTQVVQLKWLGFGPTKQAALDFVKTDWVFWVDADERVDNELKMNLMSFKPESADAVYQVQRINFFLRQPVEFSGWGRQYLARVFNRHNSRFDQSEVHEKLIYQGTAITLGGELHHHTYRDFRHYFSKLTYYSELGARKRWDNGKRGSVSRVVFRPVFRFLRHFFWKSGFRDGLTGFMISYLSAVGVLIREYELFRMTVDNRNGTKSKGLKIRE